MNTATRCVRPPPALDLAARSVAAISVCDGILSARVQTRVGGSYVARLPIVAVECGRRLWKLAVVAHEGRVA